MSKSAKRRAAAKRAKEGEVAAVEPPAPPAPEPKSKAKAKAKPEAKAKAEPKAEPKAKAKAEPKAQPKAEPKAKGKAKAQPAAPAPAPAPEPKAEPKAKAKATPEPKAASSKSKAKAKGKAAAKPVEVEEEQQPDKTAAEEMINYVLDDGTGGDWAEVSGLSVKAENKKKKKDEDKRALDLMKAQHGGVVPKNAVPGMAPVDPKDPRSLLATRAAVSQAASADVARILAQKEDVKPTAAVSTAAVSCPDDRRFAIVIGKGGATIKKIQEVTSTRIDTAGGMFTITGDAKAVVEAQAAVEEIIAKGYCSLLYDEFAENSVQVHPQYFPDIIGSKGAVIREIKDKLFVEVAIPPVPPGTTGTKKYKVTLAGNAKSVETAKEVINDIMMYYHHEITHPGKTHAEMEVDKWSYSYIIGRQGSELKHIQKNWDVKVYIPREHSLNQKIVIVGDPGNVERAKTYVEKVLYNAEQGGRNSRDKQDVGDVWGDEDDEEPWMKEYIYKRN